MFNNRDYLCIKGRKRKSGAVLGVVNSAEYYNILRLGISSHHQAATRSVNAISSNITKIFPPEELNFPPAASPHQNLGVWIVSLCVACTSTRSSDATCPSWLVDRQGSRGFSTELFDSSGLYVLCNTSIYVFPHRKKNCVAWYNFVSSIDKKSTAGAFNRYFTVLFPLRSIFLPVMFFFLCQYCTNLWIWFCSNPRLCYKRTSTGHLSALASIS